MHFIAVESHSTHLKRDVGFDLILRFMVLVDLWIYFQQVSYGICEGNLWDILSLSEGFS